LSRWRDRLIFRRRKIENAHLLAFAQSLQQHDNAILKPNRIAIGIADRDDFGKDSLLGLLLKTTLPLELGRNVPYQ
jgi:hypothetical protein